MGNPVLIENYGGANCARIVKISTNSGELVKTDQSLFEVENYKVVQEIDSPSEGILIHDLSVGDLVKLGVPIAMIVDPSEDRQTAARFLTDYEFHEDWPALVSDPKVVVERGSPVPIRKATEIAVLGNGAGNSMLSMVGAHLGTILRPASTADFFRGKILDLVAFEASRLLAGKFSSLNRYFGEGHIFAHERVNAGIGLDDGSRLTLYVVEDADQQGVPQLQDSIIEGLMRYVGHGLAPDQVSTATYTISDLSASNLTFSLPLLPRGQCIIIAITRAATGEYALYISFDHRVTEGLEVAAFLTELVARLCSYADELPSVVDALPALLCAYCDKSVDEETSGLGGRGLLKIVNSARQEILCCAACWQGY